MIGQSAPPSPLDALAARLARMEERIADLQRTTGRWATVPRVSVGKSGAQSVSHNALTAVTWDVEVTDARLMHDGSNPSRLTVPAGLGGAWRIGYGLQWDANSVGDRLAFISVNGSFTRHGPSEIPMTSPGYCGQNGSSDLDLVDGDYVEIIVYQSSGSALDINVSVGVEFYASFLGA